MRTVFHACVTGSLKAVEFYRRAFNAELKCCYTDSTSKFAEHAELTLDGKTHTMTQGREPNMLPCLFIFL